LEPIHQEIEWILEELIRGESEDELEGEIR
jgi:hypothetical protein